MMRPVIYAVPVMSKTETLFIFRQALQRLTASRTLTQHPALHQLLLYLAEKTLAGEDGGLKEYVIGIEAFAKPTSYDPQTDASVRVQVSRLRKCLSDYYERECPQDPVRIEIPKGQFGLTFRMRGQHAGAIEPEDSVRLKRRLAHMTWACLAASAIAIAAIVALTASWTSVRTSRPRPQLTPELTRLWESYLDGDRPVLIVLGTPLFAKLTTSETGVFYRHPKLNDWESASASLDLANVGSAVGAVKITPSRVYTGAGEATGAFLLSKLLAHSAQEVSLRRSYGLSWDDFKDRNIIVLGAPKHNSHLNHLPIWRQFDFHRGGIRNLKPVAGEPDKFDPTFSACCEEIEEDHALISRFPGMHGVGETTVLAGASTEATLAAVEYVTHPRYAADLITHLCDESGKLPPAYQVVVKAKFKSQTAIEVRYVTHRLLRTTEIVSTAYTAP